ncbi:MAG: pilus assembly protein [Lachnospiraceae bacterium]|jgi:hypothetical protein|nr:pilus assembly protein [Lachnospiraceae bacterium]
MNRRANRGFNARLNNKINRKMYRKASLKADAKLNRKSRAYFNAYMTIEAALIIPFVIGIYLFLIFTAFYLYDKTTLTQDTYILCYRGSTFTYWEDGYGEVLYGRLAGRKPAEARAYIESRSDYSRYPFFSLSSDKVTALQLDIFRPEVLVTMNVSGKVMSFMTADYDLEVTAVSLIENPVTQIRTARRKEKNDGD